MNHSNHIKKDEYNYGKEIKPQSKNGNHESGSHHPRMIMPMHPLHIENPLSLPKMLTPNLMSNSKRAQSKSKPLHTEKYEEPQLKNHAENSVSDVGGSIPPKINSEAENQLTVNPKAESTPAIEKKPVNAKNPVNQNKPVSGRYPMREKLPMMMTPMFRKPSVYKAPPLPGRSTVIESPPWTKKAPVPKTSPLTEKAPVPKTPPLTEKAPVPKTPPLTGKPPVSEIPPMKEHTPMYGKTPTNERKRMPQEPNPFVNKFWDDVCKDQWWLKYDESLGKYLK